MDRIRTLAREAMSGRKPAKKKKQKAKVGDILQVSGGGVKVRINTQ